LKRLWVILCLFFVSCASNSSGLKYYKSEREGDKDYSGRLHGIGVITWNNGEKFEGQFKNGEPYHGHGFWDFGEEGAIYEGTIRYGLKNGQGVQTFLSGEKWEGEFKDGKRYNGEGVWFNSDGSRHIGITRNGLKNGQGLFIYADGNKYAGNFKDNKPDGKGTLTYADGIVKYAGEYKDGLYHGQGTLISSNGEKYKGEFKDGLYHGQGTLISPNGEKYVGEFKNELYHGYGTLTYSNGEKYVGELSDRKRNGKGAWFKDNSKIEAGTWIQDILTGEWTVQAVSDFLINKYPQFKGFNYSEPKINVSLNDDEVNLPPVAETPFDVSLNDNEIGLPLPVETLLFIAVIDLIGNNVSDNEVKALTDRLRVELFNTKHFKVVERAMMEEILEEQGLQQSGCTTTECIVEVGKLIGVEQIVGGSISKVGNTFSVSARIVSVETGNILHTATHDYKGEIDDLLTTGMKKVAIDLTK